MKRFMYPWATAVGVLMSGMPAHAADADRRGNPDKAPKDAADSKEAKAAKHHRHRKAKVIAMSGPVVDGGHVAPERRRTWPVR